MKSVLRIILFLFCSFTLFSCDQTADEKIPVTVSSDYCVYSSLSQDLMDVIVKHFAGNRVDCGTAAVVFVDCAEIRSADIKAAYERGAVVIAVNPSASLLLPLMRDFGAGIMSAGSVDECMFVAFHRSGAVYSVDDISSVLPYANHLDGLANWINGITTPPENSSSDEVFQAAHIHSSHTMKINDATIITQRGGKQTYKMSGTGYFEQLYSVIPLFAFPTQSGNNQGDFYLINACFSVVSSDMYQGVRNVKVGGNKSDVNAFYLSGYTVETELVDSEGKSVATEFYQMPAPSTTVGSSTYTSGTSWSIDGAIAFGTPGKTASVGGSHTWSSSTTRTVSDLAIKDNSEHSGLVKYNLEVKNLPGDRSSKVPPMISRGTFDFHTGWVWNVRNTEAFDASTRYYMKVKLINLTYKASTTSNYPASVNTFPFSQEFTFELPLPNRIPSGTVVLSNSEKGEYMKDVVFIDSDNPEKRYADNSGSVYAQGEACSMVLPEGHYMLEFRLGDVVYSSGDLGVISVQKLTTLNLQSGAYNPKGA